MREGGYVRAHKYPRAGAFASAAVGHIRASRSPLLRSRRSCRPLPYAIQGMNVRRPGAFCEGLTLYAELDDLEAPTPWKGQCLVCALNAGGGLAMSRTLASVQRAPRSEETPATTGSPSSPRHRPHPRPGSRWPRCCWQPAVPGESSPGLAVSAPEPVTCEMPDPGHGRAVRRDPGPDRRRFRPSTSLSRRASNGLSAPERPVLPVTTRMHGNGVSAVDMGASPGMQ
jgi:hypothetical protein